MLYSEKNRMKDAVRRLRQKHLQPTRKQKRKHKKHAVKKVRGAARRVLDDSFGMWKKENLSEKKAMVFAEKKAMLFAKKMAKLETKSVQVIQKKWRSYRTKKKYSEKKKMHSAYESWRSEVKELAHFVNSPLAHIVNCKPLLSQYFYLLDRLLNIPNSDSSHFFFFIEPAGVAELFLVKIRLDEVIDARRNFNESRPPPPPPPRPRVDEGHLSTSRDYEEDAWEKYMNKVM